MGALREPKLLKLKVRTPQNMVLYSKSATTSLSNLCYNCIGKYTRKQTFRECCQSLSSFKIVISHTKIAIISGTRKCGARFSAHIFSYF